MEEVSYLTLNEETRIIVDEFARELISSLEEQVESLQADIQYLAEQTNIVLPSSAQQ